MAPLFREDVPRDQCFPLLPRAATKSRYRYGIHYIKMFPVEKRFQRRFRAEGNAYYQTEQRILDENSKQIVSDCQHYLDKYERLGRPKYAVDIDRLIKLLDDLRPLLLGYVVLTCDLLHQLLSAETVLPGLGGGVGPSDWRVAYLELL